MEVLIRAAEGRDFMMHARIAVLKALHHGKPDLVREPRKRQTKVYKLVR
jgi:hypothetical protein